MEKTTDNDNQGLSYGVIGNGTSAALVSKNAGIDFCCLPFFDSPAVFAKLLDSENGGSFSINPEGLYTSSVKYFEETAVLVTTFTSQTASFEVIDCMPRSEAPSGEQIAPPEILRLINPIFGLPRFSISYNPRPLFAEYPVQCAYDNGAFKCTSGKNAEKQDSVYVYTNIEGALETGTPIMTLTEQAFFIVSYYEKTITPTLQDVKDTIEKTKTFWKSWVAKGSFNGIHSATLIRSAITLKLLTYSKTGAILAAVTTSLPETIGEQRNWDYRFCWIRDGSMTARTFIRLGYTNEALAFVTFVLDRLSLKSDTLRIMYGIHGEKDLTEKTLPWLSGYKNSKPVRVGNGAHDQQQNDIFGVLLDVIYELLVQNKIPPVMNEQIWSMTTVIAKMVISHWSEPDMGIWEFRNKKQHFVYSKVLCWVALDRASKISQFFEKKEEALQWQAEAKEIQKDVFEKGWKETRGAFTQSYENMDLDAANLLMGPLGFIEASDTRYTQTVLNIEKELSKDALLFRYKNKDDFGDPKSSFTVCSFWMINALYLIGETKKAKEFYQKLLEKANSLGLYSEDIDFQTGELLGNFPQAYSHLALIDAAFLFP